MNYAELIDKIPEEEKPEILRLLRALDEAKAREAAQEHFLDEIDVVLPGSLDLLGLVQSTKKPEDLRLLFLRDLVDKFSVIHEIDYMVPPERLELPTP